LCDLQSLLRESRAASASAKDCQSLNSLGDAMPFTLRYSGAGCYTLAFKKEHVGSVFSLNDGESRRWIARIHDQRVARRPMLPQPFQMKEHRFETLQELKTWLRIAAPATDRTALG
jgi:hypothetical protein